uniref:Uncharacterized protein n=1 Tax=Anguilla anguilla TaxID=7936 RepID=A0A0E9PDX2_ANGAN
MDRGDSSNAGYIGRLTIKAPYNGELHLHIGLALIDFS